MIDLSAAIYANEDVAIAAFAKRRWPDGVVRCVHCGSERYYVCPSQNGNRMHATGARFRCSSPDCRKDFTLTTGTPINSMKLPMNVYLAMEALLASECELSNPQIGRLLGLQKRSVWLIRKKIEANGGKLL